MASKIGRPPDQEIGLNIHCQFVPVAQLLTSHQKRYGVPSGAAPMNQKKRESSESGREHLSSHRMEQLLGH